MHVCLERVEKDWTWPVAKYYMGRNYGIFSVMADVRSDGIAPLYTARGLPEKVSWLADHENIIYVDKDHDVEMVEKWVQTGVSKWADSKHSSVTHPDWHSRSWLNAVEFLAVKVYFEKMYAPYKFPPDWNALLAALQALGKEGRIVFWFDN